MKIVLRLGLFVALMLGLSACPGVTIEFVAPELTAAGSVSTNFQATLDGEDAAQDVICEDRITELSYSFTYSGSLTSWTSYLKGVTTGEEAGRETFTLNSNKVDRDGNTVTVTYTIPAQTSPLLTDGGITTEAITVVPSPRQIGATQLFIGLEGALGAAEALRADPIPVVVNCPANVEEDEPVVISNPSFSSEFTADISGDDGGERSVICDDRATRLTYSFDYSGDLNAWYSYFEGAESNDINGRADFTVNSTPTDGVRFDGNTVTVSYLLSPDSIPTMLKPVIDTQGIVVTPTVKGFTDLVIVVDDNGTDKTIRAEDIPVLNTCDSEESEPVVISNAAYTTGFATTINGSSQDIICNDRQTDVVLSFDYTGDLDSFKIYFQGKRTSTVSPTLTYTSSQIISSDSFAGVFRFEPGKAPRIVTGDEAGISTQAIVVSPSIIGESIPFIQTNNEGDFVALDVEMPIAQTCPN